jgi:hypothetical protein
MKVYILCYDVDLGIRIEGVYSDPAIPTELAKQNNDKERFTWEAEAGTFTSSDQWHVEEYEIQ